MITTEDTKAVAGHLHFLVEGIEEETHDHRNDLLGRIAVWLFGINRLRKVESSLDAVSHRATLTGLLAIGESLMIETRDMGVEVTGNIAATVEMLRGDYLGHYGGMSEKTRAAVLSEAFGVPT